MKKIFKFLSVLAVAAVFTGCYKHVPEESMAPVEVKDVALDRASPSKDETDLIVIAHVKKRVTEDLRLFANHASLSPELLPGVSYGCTEGEIVSGLR